MRCAFTFFCMLAVLAGMATAQKTSFPVQPGGRLFPGPDVEALLARPFEPHVPMACVGQRLWAAHPEGWAFPAGVYYYALVPGKVGFNLDFRVDDRPIPAVNARAFPSHVATSGSAGGVAADGWKWITYDDVLAARVRLRNSGSAPASVAVRLTLPVPSVEERGSSGFGWTEEVSELKVHLLATAEDFSPEHRPDDAARSFWIEGEAPETQSGSNGPVAKAGAHGGAVLGSDFGADTGDFAEWVIQVTGQVDTGVLAIRYARLNPGEAAYRVMLDDVEVAANFAFGPTGGWGDKESQLQVVSLPIGLVQAGEHRVRIEALEKDAHLNVDLLAIHDAQDAFALPSPRAHVRLRMIEVPATGEAYVNVFLAASTQAAEAEQALARVSALEDPLHDQVNSCQAWRLANVPSFTSEDAALEKMYWHRATSIIRKNLFRLGEGRLARWSMAEGRWSSEWFANVISYGGGHHIRETRWLRDPLYVRDIISTWCENNRENGLFPSHIPATGAVAGQYTDWIASAVWDAYRVQPDDDVLRAWLPALKRNVDGWLAEYDKDDDGLLLVDSHGWTGMEWQPSFFFFNGFDKDKQDQCLERVDLTAYVYGGAKHLAEMCRVLGDEPDAIRYEDIATRIHDAVARVMWDSETRYFYSVEPESHEKALVKEIVGVYPFYFAMFDPATDSPCFDAWQSLVNPAELWTSWPVASASKQCPAYSQDVRFNGKTVGGCMWNGPTWPHANSIVLSAMAETLRERPQGPLTIAKFHELLRSYTNAQFLRQELQFPWTGEYYNGDTGEWRTDERDYNHSTFLDILIADLAGVRPLSGDRLEIRPLIEDHTPGFLIDGVRYHGHDLTLIWTRPAAAAPGPDGRVGFRVYVDGILLYTSEDRTPPRRIVRNLSALRAAE